jgi:hypothetical protein
LERIFPIKFNLSVFANLNILNLKVALEVMISLSIAGAGGLLGKRGLSCCRGGLAPELPEDPDHDQNHKTERKNSLDL